MTVCKQCEEPIEDIRKPGRGGRPREFCSERCRSKYRLPKILRARRRKLALEVLVALALVACGDNLELEPDAGAGDVDAGDIDVDAAPRLDAGPNLVDVGVLDVGGFVLAHTTLPLPIAPVWCEVRHELAGELVHVTAWFHSAEPGDPADVGAPVSATFASAGVYRAFGAAGGRAVFCRSVVP